MEASKILIVEDERKIADTLKFGLTEIGFYVVSVHTEFPRQSLSRKVDCVAVCGKRAGQMQAC